ncbi:MAG: prepilin-type N-terminal cleavage/methylation domain-containing protein [Candidatus Omnitrophota bacterium]
MNIRKGFTLIEMIVVVIVLSILASIAGVQYSKIIERSRGAEAKQVLLTAYVGYQRRVAEEEPAAWSDINGQWGKLGMSDPNSPPTCYFIYSFNNAGNIIKLFAIRKGDAAKNLTVYLANGTLVVTPPY